MKKKSARSNKPAPRKASPRKARKKAKPVRRAARAKKSAPARPASALAQRMTAFSEKILGEEESPVAVRSFVEARQGVEASQELLPKTGEVTPLDEEQGGEQRRPARAEPFVKPLTGEMSVSKPVPTEFQVQSAPKKKRKVDTPDDFGPVELRQATASGGRHITRALPENLQRAAGRIEPLANIDEKGRVAKKKGGAFEVGRSAGGDQAPLTDFGEVEIAQQTLSGKKKVGKLPESDDEKS